MKKNKLYILIVALISLNLSSCNDKKFLEEVPKDFLAPQNAYSSIQGIRQGITGLHFKVRNDWFFGEELQDVTTIYRGLGTDAAFHGEDPNSTRFLCNYVNYLTPASPYVKDYWDRPFRLIQYANVLIEGIEKANPSLWTGNQKNQYLAEARFFRAYAYRHLVSFFGDVPVISEAIKTPKTDFERDPASKAYALMEEDLKFGTSNLPEKGQEENPGRITKAAAFHLLTEVYLMQKKYTEAVSSSSEVIDKLGYKLMTQRFGSNKDVFGSGDVYADLFAYGNQNLSENTETIWAIQFEPPTIIGGSNARGGRAFGPAYFRMGNTPDGKKAFMGELLNGTYTGYSDTLGRGVAWIRPTNLSAYTVWANNWSNDIRNAPHTIKRDFYFDNAESSFNKKKIDFKLYPASASRDAIRDTCQYIYPFFMKFHDPLNVMDNFATSGNGANYKDFYAMRVAETHLLRAEAYLGLGNQAAAAQDINAVRQRSKAKAINASEATIDYLLDERIRELYGEECRHMTLRRSGKLVERVKKYNNNPLNPGLNIKDYHALWPIPQDQIDLNVDKKWTQNPGY